MFLLLETTHFSTCINTVAAIKDLEAFIPIYTIASKCHHFSHCADAEVCDIPMYFSKGRVRKR